MKKFAYYLLVLVCGCASPQYELKINSTIDTGGNKTIKVVSPDKNVATTKLKLFFEEQLKSYGFRIVSANKNSDYGFVYGIQTKNWQTVDTIPIWGKTGINSINTNTFGNMQGNASTYYSGNLPSS